MAFDCPMCSFRNKNWRFRLLISIVSKSNTLISTNHINEQPQRLNPDTTRFFKISHPIPPAPTTRILALWIADPIEEPKSDEYGLLIWFINQNQVNRKEWKKEKKWTKKHANDRSIIIRKMNNIKKNYNPKQLLKPSYLRKKLNIYKELSSSLLIIHFVCIYSNGNFWREMGWWTLFRQSDRKALPYSFLSIFYAIDDDNSDCIALMNPFKF